MTDLAAPRTHEADPPYPPRYRWLARLTTFFLLIVAAVSGVRIWWGGVAERRLAAAVNAAHARGEKILVSDYKRPHALPDERNAAFFLLRAEASLKFSATEEWALDSTHDLPLRADVYQVVDAALAKAAPALADIRRAREVGQADWGVNVASPMWSVLLPHLNKARRLANISRSAAMHAAHGGDHAGAVEHVRDILATGRSLDDARGSFLVTHLVQVGIDAMADHYAGRLAIDLQLAGATDAATRPARAPATRQQVRALIDELLDDGPRRRSMHAALQGERASQIDIGQNVARRARIVQPSIQLDMVGLAREGERVMAAAAAADVATAAAGVPNPPAVTGPRVTAHVVSESIRPALGRGLTVSLRAATTARLAAVALAVRLYQLEHGGQRPATLDALVPDYLPAVPADPYGVNGQPLRYIADPIAPYVYSVGQNGKDDSAQVPPWRPDATSTNPLKTPDLFQPLSRANAPPPEPIEDPPEPELKPGAGAGVE